MKRLFLVLVSVLLLSSCASTNSEVKTYNDVSELDGQRIGCMSGSIFDAIIRETFKKSEVVYFNSRAELINGLKQNKIDAYLADEPIAMLMCNENDDVTYLKQPLGNSTFGICFSKDNLTLQSEFNEFLSSIEKNGTLELLHDKWLSFNCLNEKIAEYSLSNEKGILNAITTPDAAPFSFIDNNEWQGLEVELLYMFCSEYGYGLKIDSSSFDALLSAVASNKYDVAFNGICITEERKKSINFSNPICDADTVAMIRKPISGQSEHKDIITSIKDKIYRNFINGDSYKLIIKGMFTTFSISFLSILFGTICGFIMYLLARRFDGIVKTIIDRVVNIVGGLPSVIILMVLFYIIFSKSSLSGVAVSIIGFTIMFTGSVYGLLKSGISAIDNGQLEGALALGYSQRKSLFKFVLPQALKIVMPSYKKEIVSLVKSSSIVGYVTVQDITRVSDIIRSKTYDAFLPLLLTAIIYFVLAKILTELVEHIQMKILPHEKTAEEILKSLGKL